MLEKNYVPFSRTLLLIVCMVFFAGCAQESLLEKPILEESSVPPAQVWSRFVAKHPPNFKQFRMKIASKLSISIIKKRFTVYAWGNGTGNVRVDINTSGVPFIKAMENPYDSIFYLPSSNKGYITSIKDYKELSSLIGISVPFSLESLCAILAGNASYVFNEYVASIPRENLIEFILKDNSKLFLSNRGEILQWENMDGWKIIPKYNDIGAQIGLTAFYAPKGYSMEYLLEGISHTEHFTVKQLSLPLPAKAQLYRVEPKN